MTSELPKDTIMIPSLCEKHRWVLHHQLLRMGEDGWLVREVTVQMLMFQALAFEFRHECDSQEKLNEKFKQVRCMACYWPEAFERAGKLMRVKGLDHMVKLTKFEIEDPNWPPPERMH